MAAKVFHVYFTVVAAKLRACMVVSVVFFVSVVSAVSVVFVVSVFFDLLAFFPFFSSCLLGHLAGQALGCVAGPPLS